MKRYYKPTHSDTLNHPEGSEYDPKRDKKGWLVVALGDGNRIYRAMRYWTTKKRVDGIVAEWIKGGEYRVSWEWLGDGKSPLEKILGA
jgi:hypothetical protein